MFFSGHASLTDIFRVCYLLLPVSRMAYVCFNYGDSYAPAIFFIVDGMHRE